MEWRGWIVYIGYIHQVILLDYKALRNTGLAVLATYFFLIACDDEAPRQQPGISSIVPENGVATMKITISGSNFDETLNGNTVTFNGVEAKVINAKANELVVEAPQGGTTGPVNITNRGGTVVGPSFRYYDIYMAMTEYAPGSPSKIKLWHNGVITTIKNAQVGLTANALAVSGNDVYIAGLKDQTVAYWKNGTIAESEDTGLVTGVAVSGSDVYVCGSRHGSSYLKATYWKNGDAVDLTDGRYFNETAYGVTASNNNIYVCASEIKPDGSTNALVWKNGVKSSMPSDLPIAYVQTVFAEGDDLYATGVGFESMTAENNSLIVWKNGAPETWTDGTSRVWPTSITKNDDDIIVMGSEFTSSHVSMVTLWVNKKTHNLTDGTLGAYGMSITVMEDDVVTTGNFVSDNGELTLPFFAINEKIFPVAEGLTYTSIAGAVVR